MDQHIELIQAVRAQQDNMVAQLHRFCEVNSGSDNLLGLAKMLSLLSDAYHDFADCIQVQQYPSIPTIDMNAQEYLKPCGDALVISKRPHLKRRILLTGHMDTVYAAHHPFQTLNYLNKNELKGPGVTDMKGGLVIMIEALKAFEQSKAAAQLGWDVFINADEELGSPASAQTLKKLATNHQLALVFEPAINPEGSLAKNRSGSGKFTLIATGRAAHVGRAFQEGRNAICYLAEILLKVHALNGQREGVLINVGKIAGGEALNVVPDKAVAKLDVRIRYAEDELWFRKHMNDLIQHHQRPGYDLRFIGQFGRPVKRVDAASSKLFHRLQHLGKELNLRLDWQDSGGCCDGNNLAALGLPVLDTLGVRGGRIHSDEEFILLDSLSERAALTALLLHDLAEGG